MRELSALSLSSPAIVWETTLLVQRKTMWDKLMANETSGHFAQMFSQLCPMVLEMKEVKENCGVFAKVAHGNKNKIFSMAIHNFF